MPNPGKPRPGKPVLDTAFGSGLSRLIGSSSHSTARDIPIALIEPNPFNPRRSFDPDQISELTNSIREHGFLGVLDGRRKPDANTADPDDSPVEIAYGARRLMAAREAGLTSLPIILHSWDDGQMRMIALVENVQRQDLSPLEEADAIGLMQRELGWSIRQIVQMTGKNKAWVEDAVALANAPEDVRQVVSARADSVRHAHYIARLQDQEQRARLLQLVETYAVTARQVQEMVQAIEQGATVDDAIRRVQKANAGRQLALGHRPRSSAEYRQRSRSTEDEFEQILLLAGDVPRPVAATASGAHFLEMAIDELLSLQVGARSVMRIQLLQQLDSAGSAVMKLRELVDGSVQGEPSKSEKSPQKSKRQ